MEVVEKKTNKTLPNKRTLDRDADSVGTPVKKARVATPKQTPKKTPAKKELPKEEVPVADVLIFGSGEQGNQLPPDLTKNVKFRRKPAPVSQFQDAKVLQVYAAGYHTAVLVEKNGANEIYTWGCNDDGVLGRVINQETKDVDEATPTKVNVENVENITSLSVGSYHMHALADNGELYGWGTYKEESGFMGFLNDSENPLKQNTPLRIAFFGRDEEKGIHLSAIASSYNATIGLTTTGKVYEWGAINQRATRRSDRYCVKEKERIAQLIPVKTMLSGIEKIFAGGDIQFAISPQAVYGWGINGFGQLGSGDITTHLRPHKLKGFPDNIAEIACGQSHTLMLTEDGTVYSFGRNAYGQLGHGEDEPAPEKGRERAYVPTPKIIEFFQNMPDGEKAVKIAAGDQHSAVVTNKGRLYTFGLGEQYRLGNCTDPGDEEDDVLIPLRVGGAQLENRFVTGVACGTDHTIVIARKNQ